MGALLGVGFEAAPAEWKRATRGRMRRLAELGPESFERFRIAGFLEGGGAVWLPEVERVEVEADGQGIRIELARVELARPVLFRELYLVDDDGHLVRVKRPGGELGGLALDAGDELAVSWTVRRDGSDRAT